LSFSKVPVKYVKEAEEEDNSGFEEWFFASLVHPSLSPPPPVIQNGT
jgi:hypothetical protein